jgi:hypothetical protein
MSGYGTADGLPPSRFTSTDRWNCEWLPYLGVWVAVLNANVGQAALSKLGVVFPNTLSAVGGGGTVQEFAVTLLGFVTVFGLFVAGDILYGTQLPTIEDPVESFGLQVSLLVLVGWTFGWILLMPIGLALEAIGVSDETSGAWLAGLLWYNAFVWGTGLWFVRFNLRER